VAKVRAHLISAFCFTIVVISLLMQPIPSADALSKKWTKSYSYAIGKSTYTLLLESPDVVSSNSNWTITVSLINEYMDKLKDFLFYATIELTVETSNGKVMKKSIQFGHYPISEFPDRLYPGGRWGPNEITFNLADEDLGLMFGQSIDASIYVTVNLAEFIKQPFRREQLPYTTYEHFSVNAGTVKIVNTENPFIDYIPYILGVAVGLSVFAAPLLHERFSSRRRG